MPQCHQCPPPLPGFLRTRQSIFALGFCKPSEQRSEHSIELAGLPEGATPVAAQQAAALHALLVTEEHQRRCQTCLNHYFCGEWQGYHPVPTSCSPELAGSRPPTGRFFTGSSQFTVVCRALSLAGPSLKGCEHDPLRPTTSSCQVKMLRMKLKVEGAAGDR